MSKSILIVDQDRKLVIKLSRRCRQLGFEVRQALTAVDALQAMDERLPDLVCMGADLPTGNDLSLCQMMETDERAAKIPVIALDAEHGPCDIHRYGAMCVYRLRKSWDVDRRIEPFIHELIVDLPASLEIEEAESDSA